MADPAGATVEWQLQYANLSDTELAALQQFFTAMEGSLNSFTFLDPAANLLAWSEDLTNAVWRRRRFLLYRATWRTRWAAAAHGNWPTPERERRR